MFTTASKMSWVQAATTENLQNAETEDENDQIVPIDTAGKASAKILRNATLKVYSGGPHGLMSTHAEQFNADLLAFFKS